MPTNLSEEAPSIVVEENLVCDDRDDCSLNDSSKFDDNAKQEDNEDAPLAKNETSKVRILRVIVICVLILSAVLMSLAVYFYTENEERQEFETSFGDFSKAVIDGFHGTTERRLEATDTLRVAYTSQATSTNSTFPTVALPNIAVRCATAQSLSQAYFLMYMPVVYNETHDAWAPFAQENQGWVQESLDWQAANGVNLTEQWESSGDDDEDQYVQGDDEANNPTRSLIKSSFSSSSIIAEHVQDQGRRLQDQQQEYNQMEFCCSFNSIDCSNNNDWCDASSANCANDCNGEWLDVADEPPADEESATAAENIFCCSYNGIDCSGIEWCDASSDNCLIDCSGEWVETTPPLTTTIFCCSYDGNSCSGVEWCDASSNNCVTDCSGQWTETLAPQGEGGSSSGGSTTNGIDWSQGTPDKVYYVDEEGTPFIEDGPGPYFPIFQASPIEDDSYRYSMNYNMGSLPEFGPALNAVVDTGRAVISKAAFIGGPKETGPLSTINYPVFDNFQADPPNVVGIWMTEVSWISYLVQILPTRADGIVCVVESVNCDQVFTYEIFGPEAVFLGFGDLHDTSYDGYLDESSEFGINVQEPVQSPTYTGIPLDTSHCTFTLHVYPSQTMEANYVTNKPVIYSVGVLVIFLFTSLVFVLYDWNVERRQDVVLSSAVKSNAIVSSLFPSTVRDRLYEENGDKERAEKSKNTWTRYTHSNQNHEPTGSSSVNGTPGMQKDGSQEMAHSVREGPPIADLFEEATVFFADLAGFTAWSSRREPREVFTLLETLYAAYDEIAERRHVFKIETIGDCYVAVTGIPNAQERHAVIMARFAQECFEKCNEIMAELALQLGSDTNALAMRIGVHSGPVTAGVLRGQRARFQLFGDTVNTAARMESNGIKNRIHASAEFVQKLEQAGKGHWAKPRADKIVAKGKGELQTYWIEPRSGGDGVKSVVSCRTSSGSPTTAASSDDIDHDHTHASLSEHDHISPYPISP